MGEIVVVPNSHEMHQRVHGRAGSMWNVGKVRGPGACVCGDQVRDGLWVRPGGGPTGATGPSAGGGGGAPVVGGGSSDLWTPCRLGVGARCGDY